MVSSVVLYSFSSNMRVIVSVAAQTGLCLTWSQTPKTGFLVTGLIYIFLFLVSTFRPPSDEYTISTISSAKMMETQI